MLVRVVKFFFRWKWPVVAGFKKWCCGKTGLRNGGFLLGFFFVCVSEFCCVFITPAVLGIRLIQHPLL